MHELSLAVNIVDVACQEVCRHEGHAIAVHLNLGTFSGVVKESLLSAWLLARQNTPLENAELVITDIDAMAYCQVCSTERRIASMLHFCCAECGATLSSKSKILRGRELEITALEFNS